MNSSLFSSQPLDTLVEHRTTYSLDQAELHLYETHMYAELVSLKFSHPVLASMLRGKKIMHLRNQTPFDFHPGESVILPSEEEMIIDFPEAHPDNPTHCLALAIDEKQILDVCNELNDKVPKVDQAEWEVSDDFFHFTNDVAIQQIIKRLLFVFAENHPSKQVFANMMMKELLIRLMQTQSRFQLIREAEKEEGANRLRWVIRYIKNHLSEDMKVSSLSQKVYMSESHFYRTFKHEMGLSPNEFINQCRIQKAKSLLEETDRTIKEIAYSCGFNNLSYFSRLFKRQEGLTPSRFRAMQ